MKLIEDFKQIREIIDKSGTYIASKGSREIIRGFYKSCWLPVSEDFKKKFGNDKYEIMETNARAIYELAKKTVMRKHEFSSHLDKIEEVLEEIEFDSIRKYGSVIEIKAKEEILAALQSKGFEETIKYVRKAESEFTSGNFKETCSEARLAIEEFLRSIRERISGTPIKRGTLGNHIDYLQNQAKIMTPSERQLIQTGFYSFLSEKGGHATKDIPSSEDAKVSLYILYIIIEYVCNKLKDKI